MKIAKVVSKITAASFVLVTLNVAALPAGHEGHSSASSAPVAVASKVAAMSDGEVKKVDKEAGRLTIKHGPLENLGMSGMTMIFGVKDASMLGAVKAGDKIKFVAEKLDGRFVVTQLELQK